MLKRKETFHNQANTWALSHFLYFLAHFAESMKYIFCGAIKPVRAQTAAQQPDWKLRLIIIQPAFTIFKYSAGWTDMDTAGIWLNYPLCWHKCLLQVIRETKYQVSDIKPD